MIFWNMKYLFYNCQLLLLCCACYKFAIQAFVQEDRQAYKQHLQKDWQFYRRQGTHRYLIDSCKNIIAFCHNHWLLYRRNVTRQYLNESCKKITAFCHNHQRLYRRNVTRRYFTESCKKITAPATITDGYTNIITDRRTNAWHRFQRTWLLDCLVGRHIHQRTRQIQCAHDLTHSTDGFADGRRKIWRDFQNFGAKIN
jgi:hypothetical protein